MWHTAEPAWPTLAAAPKAISLDDADHISRNAPVIGRNVAWSRAMPPGNITDMSSARATIAAWLSTGAPVR